jgi:signal transduction histidine kinase
VDLRSVAAGLMARAEPLIGFRVHTGGLGDERYDLVFDTGELDPRSVERRHPYLRGTLEIPFYHYRLWVDAWTTPAFEAQTARLWPWWIMGGGFGMTGLVAALLYLQVRAREAQQSVLDALREANERLLAAYRERELLSRDLHDGSIQNLYALGLHLQRVGQLLGSTPARAQVELRESLGMLDHSIAELRKFILSAGVDALDTQTTGSALAAMIERMGRTTPLDVRCELHPAADQLSARVGMQLLHLVREAVSNAIRHSEGRQVTVRLEPMGSFELQGSMHKGSMDRLSTRDEHDDDDKGGQGFTERAGDSLESADLPISANGRWRLTIEGDGRGFDPAQVRGDGMGLRNVAARARDLNGTSRIESVPGQGTKVVVEFAMTERGSLGSGA